MNKPENIFTKERVHFNLARLKKSGSTFEVVLKDPEKAYLFRQGQQENIRDIINSEHIFTDAKKGEFASETELQKTFNTSNILEIAKKIILQGEINLTVEQRKKLNEAKKKKIINYIHQNGFNPKTGLPHPVQRIENAMEQAKININPEEEFEYILKKVIEKLKTVLPLSFEKIHLKVIIPKEHAAHTYNAVKKYNIFNESWNNDGSVSFEMSIVAGAKSDIYSILNKLTSGTVIIEEKR